jgi:SpoVK/Ycf46/Vps4 family AAA+-type ATPase
VEDVALAAKHHIDAVFARLRVQAALAHARSAPGFDEADVAMLNRRLVAERVRELESRAAGHHQLPIDRLACWFALRPIDEDALLSTVALECDPTFATTLGAIAGELPRAGITPTLLRQLLGLDPEAALELGLDDAHPLVVAGFLESAQHGVVAALRAWRAAPRLARFLAGEPIADLDEIASIATPDVLESEHLADAYHLIGRSLTSQGVAVIVAGPDGAGRRTLVAEAARRHGRATIAIDLDSLAALKPDEVTGHVRVLRREAWLRDAVIVLARADRLRNPDTLAGIVNPLVAHAPIFLTTTTAHELPELPLRTIRIELVAPPAAARARLWRHALADSPELDVADLAERFAATPSTITRAVEHAKLLAGTEALSIDQLHAGLAAVTQQRFGGLATKVLPSQQWEDLVLPADTLDEVTSFVSRATNAAVVYERWGFRNKLQRGLGLAALFSGPPGTGKTMVAGLIARALRLDLYVVDLSQVVSKWVGETEKQLGRIFDAAMLGRAVLLFDEADSLFAKRTEVKSSNDRYANLEVNYLLQRLERFDGIAILTTNFDGGVDAAFKRRVAAEIRFYAPERAERERLWRAHLPAATPVTGPLDFAGLADMFTDMCGGHIRNAVLRAAFLAAAERSDLTYQHLVRAGRTEYRNMGKVA